MKLQIFAVYDSKAEAYLSPFFMQSKGQAIRAFGNSASDASTDLGRHPEDFTLFHLGEYDDQNASFSLVSSPISIGLALELVDRK
jgi:hypothetical protein